MSERKLPNNKMRTMPIGRLLFTMALPLALSMLVQALYNIVDSLFVARIEEDALTAVSLAFSMQNLMIAVAIGTGVGFSALVSKSLGERNFEMANRAANNAIPLYALTYLLFLVMAFTMTEPFFEAQHASAKITQYGIDYMKTVLIFSFGMLMQICLERMLLATGKTFYSMITQATGAIINIILDPIFIFALDLGVQGAALATVISQGISAFINFVLYHIRDMRRNYSHIKVFRNAIFSAILSSIEKKGHKMLWSALLRRTPAWKVRVPWRARFFPQNNYEDRDNP